LINKQFLAHSKNNSGQEHLLIEHLKGVSDLAKKFAEPFGAGKIAALLGLLGLTISGHHAGLIILRSQQKCQVFILDRRTLLNT